MAVGRRVPDHPAPEPEPRMKAFVIVASTLLSTTLLLGQETKPPADGGEPPPSLFPTGYLDHERLGAALKRLAAEDPKTIRVRSLAKTGQGRDVWLVTLGRTEPESGSVPP